MHNAIRTLPAAAALAAFATAGLGGCAAWQKMNNKERGAAIGAATGAAAGAAVGKHQGSTAKGAIIGAVLGGAAGAVIGHQMDQQAKEIEQKIPGATVERVGEGLLVTFESGIVFPFDSDDLLPQARTNLKTLADNLSKVPNTDLMIVGHTDARGTDDYNLNLSRERARAAAEYLISQGVGSSRIRTMGLGETEPVASNDDDAGRSRNRRVEVAIYANEAAKEEARKRSAP